MEHFLSNNKLRNVAIIAHVDHGKTTLVDKMLTFTGTVSGAAASTDRIMDSGDIERERGITILAKNTSVMLPDCKINIVDTPGHMDFGGEVERTLQMVEGFLLLVDAAEGPLPGTRFVLQKALALNLKPIVVINKIDRKDADIEATENKIQDLFLEIATDADQLDFPVLYGSSKNGYMSLDSSDRDGDMQPLIDAIIKYIPEPVQTSDNLQLLVTNIDYSDYLGRIAIGRVFNGEISLGKQIICCNGDDTSRPTKISKIYQYEGVNRVEVEKASFGDIISVTGFEDEDSVTIGTTICDVDKANPIEYKQVDEPTLNIYFSVNDSPMFGREGKLLTSRQIRDRLQKELKTNIALRVEDTDSPETFKVSGRGQLHLSILVENMRREGFEVALSAPEVIYKKIDGKKCEPIELLTLDIEEAHQGPLMEILGKRKAIMESLEPYGEGKVRVEFSIPARGLIGFRSQFVTETRGTGLMNHRFLEYAPYKGEIPRRLRGALVSMEPGTTTAYALDTIQERGTLFIRPGDEVYEGMIIGEHSRGNDLAVNPAKKKKLTNMRSSGADDTAAIAPPRKMTLEMCLDWISEDELIEVTPKAVRLRKGFLKAHERKQSKKDS